MRLFKSVVLLAVCTAVSGCAANMVSSHKAEGYDGKINKLAVFVVDFQPGSESYANGTKTESGRPRSDLSAKMATNARELMSALRDNLPGLINQSGLQETFAVIQSSQISRLAVDDPNRKALVIRASQIRGSCSSGGCVTRISLKTEIYDVTLHKSVWTAETNVGQSTIFDGPINADHVREYWKLIYDKLRQDGLIA